VKKLQPQKKRAARRRRPQLREAAKRFLTCEEALEVTEYAIILGLITISILLLLSQIGGWVLEQYRTLAEDTGGG
jgi:Flp pilus assembly pilin Flp